MATMILFWLFGTLFLTGAALLQRRLACGLRRKTLWAAIHRGAVAHREAKRSAAEAVRQAEAAREAAIRKDIADCEARENYVANLIRSRRFASSQNDGHDFLLDRPVNLSSGSSTGRKGAMATSC